MIVHLAPVSDVSQGEHLGVAVLDSRVPAGRTVPRLLMKFEPRAVGYLVLDLDFTHLDLSRSCL